MLPVNKSIIFISSYSFFLLITLPVNKSISCISRLIYLSLIILQPVNKSINESVNLTVCQFPHR